MIWMLVFLLVGKLKAPYDLDLHALPVKEKIKKIVFTFNYYMAFL